MVARNECQCPVCKLRAAMWQVASRDYANYDVGVTVTACIDLAVNLLWNSENDPGKVKDYINDAAQKMVDSHVKDIEYARKHD